MHLRPQLRVLLVVPGFYRTTFRPSLKSSARRFTSWRTWKVGSRSTRWRDAPVGRAQLRETEAAARILGVQLQPAEMRTPDDLEKALEAAVAQRANALIVPRSPISFNYRTRIADLAARHRLPAVCDDIEFAEVGGLMTYGPSLRESYHRAARFVDKILKGAKPADLPLGLTIPRSLPLRADQMIR